MDGGSLPADGDIVVRTTTQNNAVTYVLATAAGVEQVRVHSRPSAIEQAIAYARRAGVRAWLTDGQSSFSLLKDFSDPLS